MERVWEPGTFGALSWRAFVCWGLHVVGGALQGCRLWLTSSTALLMSVSPEDEPPPDASEDVAEDASDDEAATEARHTASASSCIARMCLVFLLFVAFL